MLFISVFNIDPDLIREGGTIPVARTFQDVTGKSIIMLPIGGFDDGLHSQNEKMSRFNFLFYFLNLLHWGDLVDALASEQTSRYSFSSEKESEFWFIQSKDV